MRTPARTPPVGTPARTPVGTPAGPTAAAPGPFRVDNLDNHLNNASPQPDTLVSPQARPGEQKPVEQKFLRPPQQALQIHIIPHATLKTKAPPPKTFLTTPPVSLRRGVSSTQSYQNPHGGVLSASLLNQNVVDQRTDGGVPAAADLSSLHDADLLAFDFDGCLTLFPLNRDADIGEFLRAGGMGDENRVFQLRAEMSRLAVEERRRLVVVSLNESMRVKICLAMVGLGDYVREVYGCDVPPYGREIL